MIEPGEFCKVRLNAEPERTIEYAGRKYRLPVGTEVIVPTEAAIAWFGDPRSIATIQPVTNPLNGEKTFIADRPSEVRRLRFKWGLEFGDEESFEDSPDAAHAIPDVDLFTLEGIKIKTVLQDPSGNTVNAAFTSKSDDEALRSLVERQQHQIDLLLKQLNLNEEGNEAAHETELPSDDSVPEKATKPRKRQLASVAAIPDVGDDSPLPPSDDEA